MVNLIFRKLMACLVLLYFTLSVVSCFAAPAKIPSDVLTTWDKIIDVWSSTPEIKQSFLVKKVIPNTIKMLFYFASAIAVLACAYGGFLIMTALWETDRFGTWMKSFSYAIAGIIIMLLSRWIVWIVENLEITKDTFNAADVWLDDSTNLWNLPSGEIETEVIPKVIWILVETVSLVIIAMLIYAWILYVIALTEDDKRKKAKDIMTDLLIWLWILLTSYAVIAWVLRLNF